MEDGPEGLSRETILENSYLLLWWSTIIYCASLASSQYTVLAFYWRVFRVSSIRIPIQLAFGLSITWLAAQILLCLLQCIPTQAFWDLSLRDSKCKVSESAFFFGQVLTHVLLDIYILVLPVIQIGRIYLPFPKKIGVVVLFTFGIM